MKSEKKSFRNHRAMLGMAAAAGLLGFAIKKRSRREMAKTWHAYMEKYLARTALITGASSGIGRAYALRLAERGYNLVLVARRKERLEALAEECQQRFGVRAEALPADLSNEAGIAWVEQRISGGDIDFLLNNAGYDAYGAFVNVPLQDTLRLINCLELASVRLTRAALPAMLKRRRGAVINVSSIGAFTPKKWDSTYVASKAYINLFTESLALDLKYTGVRVQVLCPGFTLTEFHDAPEYEQYHFKEKIPGWLWMEPDEVVTASLQALGENRVVCTPGWINQAITATARSGLSSVLMAILASFFPERKSEATVTLVDHTPVLELLACPQCRGELTLSGSYETGTLTCTACNKEYPVKGGIPQFVQYDELQGMNRRFAGLYDWFSWIYRPFSKVAFAFIGMTEEAGRGEILDRLEPCGGKVLEVSIGPGVNLPYLANRADVGEIYGLDISNGQLRSCRDYVRQNGWAVELFAGNAEELPFKDESFESVFHIGGINFFNNKKKAIEEMIRVAKPGSRILICDETEKGARGYELTIPGFKRGFEGKRESIQVPVDLVPAEMQEVRVFDVWKGWMYCLEFRKPK